MTWVLFMNDMRGRAENTVPIFRADTREELESILIKERVDPYVDTGGHTIIHNTDTIARWAGESVPVVIKEYRWHKIYRKGGPLEWFNEPGVYGGIRHVGSREDWAQRGRESWDSQVASIPVAPKEAR